MDSKSRFLKEQERFFAEADAEHFQWQTGNRYFARTESELLAGCVGGPRDVVLEVGCGEGGNLVNLFGREGVVPETLIGLDRFRRKLVFAQGQLGAARFVCGDAVALPFRAAAFDLVLCRDLLHHLEDRDAALREIRRVAKDSATIWVVEPNGRNPLIRLLALVRPHERGQLQNSVESLRGLVERYFPRVVVEVRQPMPLHRLVLHYQFGLSRLGASELFGWVMNACDRVFRRIVPRRRWAYIVVKIAGVRPSSGASGEG